MTAQQLRNIDYNSLPISDYSRQYILRLLPHIDYYLSIYNRCIDSMAQALQLPLTDITMVDYGGGHGFLSCLAKSRGVGRVVYVDLNPQAVTTVKVVADQLGYGPDIVLQGDAATLRYQLQQSGVVPHAVLGMDVIEHVYSLEDFFADIHSLNPHMFMLFTTGSTPYNKRVVRRLRQVMVADELGLNGKPGFLALRRSAIAQYFPKMTSAELDIWAEQTRGLNYQDTLRAVETRTPHLLADPYNTCDPVTGSWTERILPIADYQRIVAPYGWQVSVDNGYYNTFRHGAKALPSRMLNVLLCFGFFKRLAPFIIITIHQR